VGLFFIRTAGGWCHAFESHDPIFPAHEPVLVEINKDLIGLFWINPSTQAGVLGCAETFEICTDKEGKKCWDQRKINLALEELKNDVDKQRIFYLVSAALENTYAYRMVNYLQASVLNATKQATRILDIQFAKEQWKVEVDNIFNASLAATQLQAYDYSRGTYAPRPNGPSMKDYTPSILQDPKSDTRVAVEISKMFIFKNNAYKNISAFWFWFVNVGCLIIFLSSRRFSTKMRRDQLIEAGDSGGYHDYLWITIFWKAICVVLAKKGWRSAKKNWRIAKKHAKAAPGWSKRKAQNLWGKVESYFSGHRSQSTTTDVERGRVLVSNADTDGGAFSVGDTEDDMTEGITSNRDDATNGAIENGEHQS
jgi:hypothetical protein